MSKHTPRHINKCVDYDAFWLPNKDDPDLIAAAPELLAAARFSVESCGCGMPKPADVEGLLTYIAEDPVGASEMCEGCLSLCAAIAKAEGNS